MNQNGEVTLIVIFMMIGLLGIIILCSLELKESFGNLQNRTKTFLCTKESIGEQQALIKFIGKTNWGIKNINKIKLIMMAFPGLQGGSMNAQNIKKYLQKTQDLWILKYLSKLNNLKRNKCPIDPKMFLTPFKMNHLILKRDPSGVATLRKQVWSYHFIQRHYLIEVEIRPQNWEQINSQIFYSSKEKKVKVLSQWLSS